MKKTLLASCLLVLSAFLVGCSAEIDVNDGGNGKIESEKISLGEEFQLKMNESVIVESEQIKITFLEVTSDSRCPVDVNCVWSGEATIKINVEKAENDLGDYSISTIPNEIARSVVRMDLYEIDLMDIKPARKSDEEIKASDYEITLKINKSD
ncbi:hypothetical protein KJ903_02900 [Patescibacteria group bacterium]|nr:hypothetical protein [Patescibacteria group bacterium]